MNIIKQPQYSKLADIYDEVMADVDYDLWADYIDALMLQHHPHPQTVMELACGTGSLSCSLDELGYYEVTGTDISPQMIAKAKEKNIRKHCDVQFHIMDFLNIESDQTYDIVISVFDSINYLHSPDQVKQFLQESKKLLSPQSLLIFDFTTPENSVQAIEYLDDEQGYTKDNYRFHRRSYYNEQDQIHTNAFHIEQLDQDRKKVIERFKETHRQKIYTLQQMLDIIDQTAYKVVAKYDGFEFQEAHENSLRITMVLQCPHIM